jgi:hypothetical protein
LRKGYDEFFGFFSQVHAHNFYPEHLLLNEREFLLRGNFGAGKKDYAPDLFTKHALEFLGKRDERPFFLYMSYNSPHANNEMGRDTGDGMQVRTTAATRRELAESGEGSPPWCRGWTPTSAS